MNKFSTFLQTHYYIAFLGFLLVGFLNTHLARAQSNIEFDIVLSGGRVIDPETRLDDIRNIGISDGKIMEISSNILFGKETIDVSGLVVAPGFVDLHVHGSTNVEQEYQARDGVTTALELEWGIPLLQEWYESRKSKAIINYGASVHWAYCRSKDMEELKGGNEELKQMISKGQYNGAGSLPNQFMSTVSSELTTSQLADMLQNVKHSLTAGGIGIGVPVGYIPGASREEVYRLYELAGELQSPIFTYVREGGTMAIQQSISDAILTGTPLHIVHINSMALGEIALAIEMVRTAQQKGFDITTELYPYTAASTGLGSAIFEEGWQERLGIDYSDLQWVPTGERLTETTFETYRKEGGTVIIHMMKPEWIRKGIASENVIVASDGMPYAKLAHPRTAGTFSRLLGKYVREEQVISLPEAIEKITLLPAKRLENIAPIMRFKGRIQVGVDADLTIFDPDKVIDKSTFEKGLEFSEGIQFVIVNGVFVVRDGNSVKNALPGQPIYGKYKN